MDSKKLATISIYIILFTSIFAQQTPPCKILVLHSYHPSFQWNAEINQGIRNVFSNHPDNCLITYEYMDTKRIPDTLHLEKLAQLYLLKYAKSGFDMIIVSDDDALQFMLHFGDDLFPETPVVFCGINNYDPSIREQAPRFTGVLEKLDKKNTVNIALSLFPQTKQIVFVGDLSTTALDLSGIFQSSYETEFENITFSYLHSDDINTIADSLEKLQEHSLVMLWPYISQPNNTLVDTDYSTRLISERSPVPVFGFWEFMLGQGIIGGRLVSGVVQGEMAAAIAIEILNGIPPNEINIVEKVPNDLSFDFNVLSASGIKTSKLDASSIIINKPVPVLEQYSGLLLGFLVAILLFAFIFLIYRWRNSVLKGILQNELNFLQSFINALPNPVVFINDFQQVDFYNKEFIKLSGLKPSQAKGMQSSALYLPNQLDDQLALNDEVLLTHKPASMEGQIKTGNNEIREVIFYKSAVFNARTKKYGLIETIVDITEKKSALEKVRESEKRYALVSQATRDGIIDWEVGKEEIFISARLKEILGYHPEENIITREYMQEYIHPEDLNTFNHQIELLKEEVRSTFEIQLRMKKKNGHYVWVEFNVFAIIEKNKGLTRMVAAVSDIQKKKEAELKQKKLEDIFRNTLMGVAVCTPLSHHLDLMNSTFARLHGYEAEELNGRLFQDMLAVNKATSIKNIFNVAAQKGHHVTESVHIRKDKSTFPVMIDITAVKNQKGETQFFIINLQDITHRKKQQDKINQMLINEQSMNEELRSSEEEARQSLEQTIILKDKIEESKSQLNSFIDGASDLAIMKDVHGRYLIVNKAFADFYGLLPEDIIGKDDYEIAPHWLAEEEKKWDQKALQENKTISYETEANGLFFETRKFPVIYDGKHKGTGAFIRNITKQKLIERQVLENEKKFKTLLENSFDLITLTDEHGMILYCTDAISKLAGITNDEAQGRNFAWLFHPADRGKFSEKTQELMVHPSRPVYIEHKIKHSASGYKTIETTGTNHLKNPLIKALVFTSRDISFELQSRELKKNIALAEKSAEIKQEFLANMSHEIRTPMNGIVGIIEFLMKTPLNEQQTDYANTIKSSADSLLNIINDILDFSKIEAGKLSIKPVPVNIKKYFEEIPKIFSALVKQKDLTFIVFVDESLPSYLDIDPIRLNQVLSNLISNAIKFTPSGEVNLRVLPDTIVNDYIVLKIEVQDTGIGISEQEQAMLFSPFSQIDSSLTRSQEGTGLGLAICQRIVNLMEGSIGVTSKKNHGSLFWLTLKTRISEHERVKQFMEEADTDTTGELKLNIMLVEDKVVNQKVIKLMLESIGCHITIANHGKEAINILEQHKKEISGKKPAFDIILMDIQMPVMDGITATRIIRERFPEYRIIIGLSANVFSSEVESYLQNGLNDYIVKPAKTQDLYKKLLYWSKKSKIKRVKDDRIVKTLSESITHADDIDYTVLNSIKDQSGDNTNVLKELIYSFHNDASEVIQNIERTLNKDKKSLKDYVHTLEKMANSMGSVKIREICKYIYNDSDQPLEEQKEIILYLKEALDNYHQKCLNKFVKKG